MNGPLTINDDLDHLEVDLSSGHDSSLAGVHALIRLLDASDVKAFRQELEPH